ncbi:hypothetical protein [Collimonas humicola]|uniref:hypothetical protein n=1 Tax=Collimonas humicola TaxID=2825886 RepID=UPI001B8AC1BB|nr:hypothetical protein [Collimonas humicola]
MFWVIVLFVQIGALSFFESIRQGTCPSCENFQRQKCGTPLTHAFVVIYLIARQPALRHHASGYCADRHGIGHDSKQASATFNAASMFNSTTS